MELQRYKAAFDWDNTIAYGPPSFRALRESLRNQKVPNTPTVSLSLEGQSILGKDGAYTGLGIMAVLQAKISGLVNSTVIRRAKPRAIKAIDMLPALNTDRVQISAAVVSGRKPSGHTKVREYIVKLGLDKTFEQILLNPGISAYRWKLMCVYDLIMQGEKVVFFDDDWLAAEAISSINDLFPDNSRVIVYVTNNLSNRFLSKQKREEMKKRGIHFMPDILSAALDFKARHEEGLF